MKILVRGGGIAALTCALEFGSRGHDVTVIERAPHLRRTDTPIECLAHSDGHVDAHFASGRSAEIAATPRHSRGT